MSVALSSPESHAETVSPSRPARWTSVDRWLTGRRGDVIVGVALFVVLYVARTIDVAETMTLLGDQIRDWRIALRPMRDLPLDGPSSVAGGNAYGPYYYWLLWAIRVVVGPWFDNLPHAGVYGLAIVHAAGDVALFVAIRRLTGSSVLALAAALLVATAPLDIVLSSTIWSPGIAVALAKVALALFAYTARGTSLWGVAVTVGVAWMAAQTHSSLVLVFAPLASWFIVRELRARAWRRACETLRVMAEVVFVLQLPYIVDRMTATRPKGAPSMIVEGALAVLRDPTAARPWASFEAILGRLARLWELPDALVVSALAVAVVAVFYAGSKRAEAMFVGLLPLVTAIAGFAAWSHGYQTYWFLGLAPSAALLLMAGVTAVPAGRWRSGAALVVLAAVLALQPSRVVEIRRSRGMPDYAALVSGAREIVRHTREVSAVRVTFDLPPTASAAFPFECMGGRIARDAEFEAVIGRDGRVTFRPSR